jgi:hypothetical protein
MKRPTFSQKFSLGLRDKSTEVAEIGSLFDYSELVSGVCTGRTLTK